MIDWGMPWTVVTQADAMWSRSVPNKCKSGKYHWLGRCIHSRHSDYTWADSANAASWSSPTSCYSLPAEYRSALLHGVEKVSWHSTSQGKAFPIRSLCEQRMLQRLILPTKGLHRINNRISNFTLPTLFWQSLAYYHYRMLASLPHRYDSFSR